MRPETASPLPRPPRPGPAGERARVAVPSDAEAVVALALEAFREARVPHRRELVEWVVQAAVHDPLRGVYVLAASEEGEEGGPLGFAAFEAAASAEHGWTARLACLYVRPAHRGRGVGQWLLEEALEIARRHGLNHVRCDLAPESEGARRLLSDAGFAAEERMSFRIDLPPLYDDEG